MYNAFFGFTRNPFNLTPDPGFLYRSALHDEALANLVYGVQSRKGFIVLTGEVGTGKTTMLECLREFLASQRLTFASVFHSRLSVQQFYEMVAHDYELRCDPSSKTSVLFALGDLLTLRATQGSTVVLIVDEAHNLDWEILEEIRLLGNLETREAKLLQIVLAGQPELDRKLEAPEFRQIKQRIALRCELRPFSAHETAEYIDSRLERAGMPNQNVFPPAAVARVHQYSQGIPRVINALCDNLLLTAFAMEERQVNPELVEEVATDLKLRFLPQHGENSYFESLTRP